jgi:hypothetical protein
VRDNCYTNVNYHMNMFTGYVHVVGIVAPSVLCLSTFCFCYLVVPAVFVCMLICKRHSLQVHDG